jgi:hypothetical protein
MENVRFLLYIRSSKQENIHLESQRKISNKGQTKLYEQKRLTKKIKRYSRKVKYVLKEKFEQKNKKEL